ncbi:tetratricopeptide repeat protein [Paraflavitalea pollutisoli]|uniref:tetratricopeptide repeat protein n=1 Tax=Paraflavitalea pollutisoli TaxID=3034143 RepID=UPI0023EAFF9D|nr:tetratricopeptide repeat protein [Paraflavitalea sp. H1-2-19X]
MNRSLTITLALALCTAATQAQTENKAIRSANKLYKEGKFEEALPQYEKALSLNPGNPVGHYNIGNARFRKDDFANAVKDFDTAAAAATTNELKQRSTYNKGVALTKQKKLQESIEAYKQALRLDPQDAITRYNLEKALSELKKQQQQNQQQQKQQEQDQKKDQKQQKPQPQPQPKLDKKKIEQFLKSLEQKEQEVQRKMQQNKTRAASQPEKDW